MNNSSRAGGGSHLIARFAISSLLLLAAVVALYAANPSSGTINSTASSPVTWVGDATGLPAGGPAGEDTCIDGTSCDVFELTVDGTAADYSGKEIVIKIEWGVPANDYDLYIHKDALDGDLVAEGENSFAGTSEQAVLHPATTGPGKYYVHVLYSTVAGNTDQYHGSATLQAGVVEGPEVRTATYVTNSGIQFSSNVALKAPATLRDGEPSGRTDHVGNSYVGGIRGVPAGVDLWYINLDPSSASFDPRMRVPFYRGQPDKFSPEEQVDVGADGGGDIDLAVGFPNPGTAATNDPPTLAFSSLLLANISTGNSTDRGATFQQNPVGNVSGGIPVDDRQWHEFLGKDTVYLWYRTAAPAITQVQRSDDGGFSYGPAVTAGTTTQVGSIDVHQATGTVYGAKSTGQVAVGKPPAPGLPPVSYTNYQAATDPNGVNHLFFVVKVADDGTPTGTVYVCYSNDQDIYLKHSTDEGQTWSKPVKVNGGIPTDTNLFPWMETGRDPGRVGIVWYGTVGGNNDDANWKVYFAQSFNATSDTPTFNVAEVTEPEHVIHGSNISEGGLTGQNNRNLIDYFQVSFDPQGAAVVCYTDDHQDYDGHTFVARQVAGPSLYTGTSLPAVAEGSGLFLPPGDEFPPQVPGPNGEQATDYRQDVQNGQLVRVDEDDPSDAVSLKYATSGTGGQLAIAATMKVSDLSVIPGQTTWQIDFAVNAPHAVLSPTGDYSFGVWDNADRFVLLAETDVNSVPTFRYGTATRNGDGTITVTPVGLADAGEFNQQDNTVSIMVFVSKLNGILLPQLRPAITNGSVISGLRGRSFTVEVDPPVEGQASRQGRRDIVRAGTLFTVHDFNLPAPAPTPIPTPYPSPSPAPSESPAKVEFANLSTRAFIGQGDNVGIGGFIVRNENNAPKRIMVRAIGPSIGLGGTLGDPTMSLIDTNGTVLATNDDWRDTQEAEISATGLAPHHPLESSIIRLLPPGGYSAVVSGVNSGQGIALIEIFDLDAGSAADLGNISTRGFVGTGDNVLIGGMILRDDLYQNEPRQVLVRGLGPSLPEFVSGRLADPFLTLVNGQGTVLATNDDWKSSDQAAIQATTIPPPNDKEAAILRTLPPGGYTAILRGTGNSTGIGLVELFNLGPAPGP